MNVEDNWHYQWRTYEDNELFLLKEWIYPNRLEDLRGKVVLEAGCGGGHHTRIFAKYADEVWAVDPNTVDIARERVKFDNVHFVEADASTMDLNKRFDVIFAIGMLHHTQDSTKTFLNLKRHLKPGGRMIIWVYAKEGNAFMYRVVEPLKRIFLSGISKTKLRWISRLITAFTYLPVYTVYMLPLRFLPYYYYFCNWRKLTFERNELNVFDKLNAPLTHFIDRKTVESWFSDGFVDVFIDHYLGVSWRASGRLSE